MAAPDASGFDEPPEDPYAEPDFIDVLRAALVDTDGLDDIPEPDPLIKGVIYRDSLTWIQGRRGNGKSFVAIDMAGCVGTGEGWQGHPVTQGQVLYLIAEGAGGMRWRVRAWEQAMGRKMSGVTWLPMPVQADSSRQWNAFIDLAGELHPTLIVVDTQARVTVGMEENSASDMGVFVDKLEKLRRASGACVCVVHHQGHTGEHMRGSTALEGAATTIVRVVKEEDEITVGCAKQKDAKEFEEISLRLVPTADSAVLLATEPDAGPTPGRTQAALKMAREWWDLFGDDEVSASKLVLAMEGNDRTVYRQISELIKAQIAFKRKSGRHTFYRLVQGPDSSTGAWS